MSPQNNSIHGKLKSAGIVVACIACTILLLGAYIRFSDARNLKTWTRESQLPTVSLVMPEGSGAGQALVLPGTLQAYYDAKLYARVPGYVHAWLVDIGARVKKGQVLATIDTPELDQQIAQARADLGSATSAQKLSAVTAGRWLDLQRQNAVARQDVDEKQADLAAKTNAARSAKANLDRMLATKTFATIVAPFDGVVTQRAADIGALVSDGTSGDPLFTVADIHALRLYVNVPQSYSAQIVPGMTVSLIVPEYPARSFPAKLVATSGAISAQSSTLLVQFEAPNTDGLLKPGGFAQVSMAMPRGGTALSLPASTLMFRAEGLRIATVGLDDRVVMKPVTIATDLGPQVIISAGLDRKDRVVNNPPDSLDAGDRVRIAGGGPAMD